MCHSVSLIIPVNGDQLHILAKINAKFEFGSTLASCFKWGHWQFPFTVASGTMLNSCLHVGYLGLLCI